MKLKGKADVKIPLILDYEFNKKKYHKNAIKIIEDIEAQTEKERPDFKKVLQTQNQLFGNDCKSYKKKIQRMM